MPRKNRSRRERVRLFELHGGKCHLCGQKIKPGEKWELEHLIAWELTRDESDGNVKPAHDKCHKPKTAQDVKTIRKADRQRAKHIGAVVRRPWSRFKKRVDGTVVDRRTGKVI